MTSIVMSSVYLCAFVITTAGLTATACRESPTQPSSSAPATSALTFQVAAGAGNAADGGSYSTANAGFGASIRTDPARPTRTSQALAALS